jgi:hypothetical protein
MHEQAEDWRRASASWLQRSIEEKLGRCSRCMTLSALLLVGGWASVVLLARTSAPSVAVIAAATLAAALWTALAVAHALAYVLRRAGRGPSPTRDARPAGVTSFEPTRDPSSGGARRRGCGCGR